MTGLIWQLADTASRLLDRDEREAVLGDLVETGESAGQVLLAVASLAFRRQARLWRNWRPWLAAFGLALPCTLFLMGFSVTISRTYQSAFASAAGFTPSLTWWMLLCNTLLLVGWAWTGGFVVGSLSRRTVWVSLLCSFLPCVFCFTRFNVEWASRLCLFLFVAPAVWGLWRGLRIPEIQRRSAVILALTVTALTIPAWTNSSYWLPNWTLSWPAWYLVATTLRRST